MLSAKTTEMKQGLYLVFGDDILKDIHSKLGIEWSASIVSVQELMQYVGGCKRLQD